jgi:uncharacterized Tic20 family protein
MTNDFPAVPEPVPSDSRGWAAAAHLGTFLIGFIAPLVIWLVKKDEDAFVEYHARESLNFQFSLMIYMLVSFLAILILIGIVMIAVVGVFAFVVIIVAGVKAAGGEFYRYPLSIRFISGP